MKRFKDWLGKRGAAYTFAACSAVVLYMILSHLGPLVTGIGSILKGMSTIFIGLAIAYLVDPIVIFFERVFSKIRQAKLRRVIAVVAGMACVICAIVLFFVILVPSLIDSTKDVINNFGLYFEKIQSFINRINSLEIGIKLDLDDMIASARSAVTSAFTWITSNFSEVVRKLTTVGSSIFNWIIGFILAAYFLLGKNYLVRQINRLRKTAYTEKTYERRNRFWKRCHEIFIQFIGCDLLDALIVGVANAVFMSVMGMSNIALVSLTVGVTNLLPTFGPIAGGVIGALILLLTNTKHALWFIIFTLILQTIDGYIIKPRLFSASLNMPAVWSLIAIILGGKLFGVLGIFLSIPIAAVLAMLYREEFIPWIERKKQKRIEAAAADSLSGPEGSPDGGEKTKE